MCECSRLSCHSRRAVIATVLTLVVFAAMPGAASAQIAESSPAAATDVSATRLFFSPTGRSLPAGKGYVSLLEFGIPVFQVGVTDRISIGAGAPAFGLAGFMVTPKLQVIRTAAASMSVGVMQWMAIGESSSGGVAFAVVTKGPPDESFTIGAFVPYSGSGVAHAWLLVGGEKRIGARTRFITENHIMPGEFGLFCVGVRFGNGRLSADFGVGVLAAEGGAWPGPLLNVSYRF